MTQFKERTFFNDGTIQYIENALNKRVDSLGVYENTTVNTNTGTANTQDEEDCDEFIEEAIQMLGILGLDLITYEKTEEDSDVVADDVSTGTVPDVKSFSPRNLLYMHQFYKVFNDCEITQQVVSQIENKEITQQAVSQLIDEPLLPILMIPWGHIVLLLNKSQNDREQFLFYARKVVEGNWSKSVIF